MQNKRCMNCGSENLHQINFYSQIKSLYSFVGKYSDYNLFDVTREFYCNKCQAQTKIQYITEEREQWDA